MMGSAAKFVILKRIIKMKTGSIEKLNQLDQETLDKQVHKLLYIVSAVSHSIIQKKFNFEKKRKIK